MIFYRALIIFAPIVGIVIIADLLAPGAAIDSDLEVMIAIVWFLFTVQVYEETKAAVVIATKGAVYGRLNESFSSYGTSKHWLNALLWLFPPAATGAWIISFFVLLYMWFI
ncbi:MAG: hypothetical protein KGH72_00035 [Candidatus Micrarchaeota archaeon]|nr:hypothetical protein [Candidatus Micrarchaeota archaeon]